MVIPLTIKEIRMSTGLSQAKFAELFKIPKGTLAHWEQGVRKPPEYVVFMLKIIVDLSNSLNE